MAMNPVQRFIAMHKFIMIQESLQVPAALCLDIEPPARTPSRRVQFRLRHERRNESHKSEVKSAIATE